MDYVILKHLLDDAHQANKDGRAMDECLAMSELTQRIAEGSLKHAQALEQAIKASAH